MLALVLLASAAIFPAALAYDRYACSRQFRSRAMRIDRLARRVQAQGLWDDFLRERAASLSSVAGEGPVALGHDPLTTASDND